MLSLPLLRPALRRRPRLLAVAFLVGSLLTVWSVYSVSTYRTLRGEIARNAEALGALHRLGVGFQSAASTPVVRRLADDYEQPRLDAFARLLLDDVERLERIAETYPQASVTPVLLRAMTLGARDGLAEMQEREPRLAAAAPDARAAIADTLALRAAVAGGRLLVATTHLHQRQTELYAAQDRGWYTVLGVGVLVGLALLAAFAYVLTQSEALHARTEALEEARRRAEGSARLEAAFLANMSHEIRTPLTALVGLADALREDLPPVYAPFADALVRSARRLQSTLTSILEIAALEGGEQDLPLGPVDAVRVARDAVETLRPLAEPKGLTLRLDAPPSAWVEAEACALGRVLAHLVGNAVKFTEHGGVTVRLCADDDAVRIEVEDTGCGISPDFQPFLFSKFRQERMGADRPYEGSGLGLAITQRLVALQGGVIDLASRPGEGTVITVVLRRVPAPTPAALHVLLPAAVEA